jgi:hypothetical protein
MTVRDQILGYFEMVSDCMWVKWLPGDAAFSIAIEKSEKFPVFG